MFATDSTNYSIDKEQAKRQLVLLGYKPSTKEVKGDTVFIRAFPPEKGNSGRKAARLNWAECEGWLNEGLGIYFVVNGQGHTDSEVKLGRAIFTEHDDLPKEQQLILWQSLGLPEPTFQVDTGGKSIHSYWVFESPIYIDVWSQLQKDLLEFTDGDRKICNPSRVMRLAGAWHLGTGQQTRIVSESGKKYSFEELRSAIPERENPQPTYQPPLDLNSGDVPLSELLKKSERDLLNSGVGSGSRNDEGARLARNLLGTFSRLPFLGIRCSENPRQLFDQFCSRCNPPIDSREADQIWKSAQKSNPTATLSDDALENCAKAWLNRGRKTQQSTTSQPTKQGNLLIHPRFTPTDSQELLAKLNEIRQSPIPGSQAVLAISSEAKNASVSPSDAFKALNELDFEENLGTALIQGKAKLQELHRIATSPIDLRQVFPDSLATALISKAEADRVDPVRVLQTVLPIVGTLLGGRVGINLKPGVTEKDSFIEYPIFYTADISWPSSGKSATSGPLIEPLQEIQDAELERVEKAFEELDRVKQEWDAKSKEEKIAAFDSEENPKVFEKTYCQPRKWLFDMEITAQALSRRLAEQPEKQGCLWQCDELSGLFEALDQFTGGKGNQKQFLLKAWNKPLRGSTDRVDTRNSYWFKGQCLNISGNLQPKIASKIFRVADDPDGMLSRILPALSQLPADFEKWNYTRVNIYEPVKALIQKLADLPEMLLTLSGDAEKLFIHHWENLRRGYRANLADNPAYSYFLGKQISYTGRFAIVIHLLAGLYSGKIAGSVDGETMKKAIALSRFYCSQFLLLQSSTAEEQPLEGILLEILNWVEAEGGKVTVRDLMRSKFKRRSIEGKKFSAHLATKFLQAIADAGFGSFSEKTFSLSPTVTNCHQFVTTLKTLPEATSSEICHQNGKVYVFSGDSDSEKNNLQENPESFSENPGKSSEKPVSQKNIWIDDLVTDSPQTLSPQGVEGGDSSGDKLVTNVPVENQSVPVEGVSRKVSEKPEKISGNASEKISKKSPSGFSEKKVTNQKTPWYSDRISPRGEEVPEFLPGEQVKDPDGNIYIVIRATHTHTHVKMLNGKELPNPIANWKLELDGEYIAF